jgi:hypothetical protein
MFPWSIPLLTTNYYIHRVYLCDPQFFVMPIAMCGTRGTRLRAPHDDRADGGRDPRRWADENGGLPRINITLWLFNIAMENPQNK